MGFHDDFDSDMNRKFVTISKLIKPMTEQEKLDVDNIEGLQRPVSAKVRPYRDILPKSLLQPLPQRPQSRPPREVTPSSS